MFFMHEEYHSVQPPMHLTTLTIPNHPCFMFYFFVYVSGMAEARTFKYCTQVGYSSYQFLDDKLRVLTYGRGQSHVTYL